MDDVKTPSSEERKSALSGLGTSILHACLRVALEAHSL